MDELLLHPCPVTTFFVVVVIVVVVVVVVVVVQYYSLVSRSKSVAFLHFCFLPVFAETARRFRLIPSRLPTMLNFLRSRSFNLSFAAAVCTLFCLIVAYKRWVNSKKNLLQTRVFCFSGEGELIERI